MKLAIVILSVLLLVSIIINVIFGILYFDILKKFADLIKRVEHYRELLNIAQKYINKKTKNNETKYKRLPKGDNV